MIVPDANLLLYAYDTTAEPHAAAKRWLEDLLSGTETVGFAWVPLLAFVRISTNPRALRHPLGLRAASDIVDEWLAQPCVRTLSPLDGHWQRVSRLLADGQARGGLVMDAHLAAMAMENGAALHTTDRDFARFRGLRVLNPLE